MPYKNLPFSFVASCLLIATSLSAQTAAHPDTVARVRSGALGGVSVVCVQPAGDSVCHPIFTRDRAWEASAALNADRKLVAYSAAGTPLTKSEILVSKVDGGEAKRASRADEDAIDPAFGSEPHTLFYLTSGAFGHASPIASSRRHKFDVMSVKLDDAGAPAEEPIQLTHQEFYEVGSLAISPDGKQFLLSVDRYPEGSMLEEYDVADARKVRASYQPHVKGEASGGAIFGGAAYEADGKHLVFVAASGGFTFNYNIYEVSKSDVKELVQLTHGEGLIDDFAVDRDGTISFRRDGHAYRVDPETRAVTDEGH